MALPNLQPAPPIDEPGQRAPTPGDALDQYDALTLAQALLKRLSIGERDWHRLKGNRLARAQEQAAAALVFLLKQQPQEALVRLQQSVGWLDRSLTAPPCPTHGSAHPAASPPAD
jgi:Family of unknown function (DUF6439)